MNKKLIKRKKLIIFYFEGKNNKTETIYFKHFKAFSHDFYLRTFPSGANDPLKMVESAKRKRKHLDYNAREDLTFIFIDIDNDNNKKALVNKLNQTLPKDIKIVLSCPSFEIWFLNHFIFTTRYFTNKELLIELSNYIDNYQKNVDVYERISNNIDIALLNSKKQKEQNKDSSFTDVYRLLESNYIIKR